MHNKLSVTTYMMNNNCILTNMKLHYCATFFRCITQAYGYIATGITCTNY